MLVAVLGYSLLPLMVDLSGDWGSVALVTGAWAFTHSIVNAAAAHRWRSGDGLGVRSSVMIRRIPWWAYATAFVAAFQWVFFAWSSRLTETAITTLIFEFWPVLFLVGRRVFPAPDGKRPMTLSDAVLVGAAFIGLSLVIFGNNAGSASSASWVGAALAAMALIIAAGERIVHLRSGEIVAEALRPSERTESVSASTDARTRTRAGALQNVVARGSASVLLLGLGAIEAAGGGVSLAAIGIGVGLGAVHSVSGLMFTFANHLSDTDTINSIYFAVPTLALLWLWGLTEVNLSHPASFVAGGMGVLVINMVIHLDPEGTGRHLGHTDTPLSDHGYKALILSLWASGSFVVLRDDLLPSGLLFWQTDDYWTVLTLLTTVFVFILSFRQSRIAEREREADRLALKSLAEIEMLRDEQAMNQETADELIERLSEIDREGDASRIGDSYLKFRRILLADRDNDTQRSRRELLLDVEILTNLRQQGREMTEVAVMALFAILIAFVALLFRPARREGPLSLWEGSGTELIAMCIAAAVVFLVFDLVDRRRLRDSPRLRQVSEVATEQHQQPPGWRLNLHTYGGQPAKRAARVVSALLGVVIIAVFAVLLVYKWHWLLA